MSGALDKVRERRRRKSEARDRRSSEDSGRRLAALLPGRRKSRIAIGLDGLERKLSANSSTSSLRLGDNHSQTSLGQDESGHSSILTEDNSDGERTAVRPTLSPHDSHTGYLTLTSPEINAVQLSPVDTEAIGLAPSPSLPQIIIPPNDSGDGSPIVKERNSSPVGKLRAALSRKQSGSDLSSTNSSGSGLPLRKQLAGAAGSTSSLSLATEKENNIPEPIRTSGKAQSVGDSIRPQTPSRQVSVPRLDTASAPTTPPNTSETPQTFVTPPTPTDSNAEAATFLSNTSFASRISSPTRILGGTRHRRSQSAAANPSKLSQSTIPPLTPTLEETKTPGGTLTAGFFSSFISVAQRAADQFSLGSTGGSGIDGKSKDVVRSTGDTELGDKDLSADATGERRSPALETLGTGNLSFSHLGITENTSSDPMSSTTELAAQGGTFAADELRKAEENAANRAVTAAYEKPVGQALSQLSQHSRPLSNSSNDHLTLGEQTPPRIGIDTEPIKRSGSVRSKISGRRRRHRASSATAGTGNSIGAALAASGTGLVNPTANGAGHRLTGFAVASSKRNKDFHQLFRSVPEDDYLIEDYSAALQRDILLQGRLYISEGHICFSSNILGWVTNLVISFDEVVSVEKKSTAVIFPNAIVIQTMHARNTFASLVARDSTYELLIGIWKISHPNLKSSLNGVTLDDAGTGDKTEVAEPERSDDEESSESGSEDDVYDEDADDDEGSFAEATLAPSIAGSDIGETTASRKPSGVATGNGSPPSAAPAAPKGLENADAVVTGAAVSSDFPGPATHGPTQCSDEHYERPIMDATISAPLGKIYSMMFGPASGAFMSKWLVEDQKSRELNYPDDKPGLDNDHKSVTFDYIKPLYGAIGPKQTKCITTSELLAFDLEKAVTVDCSTLTPDVPSGSLFTTKTRYCLMWASENSTRMVATCTIEWTGKSWIRSAIDKGANDGQIDYVKALVTSLGQAVATKPPVKGVAKKGKRKGKKEVFDADAAVAQRKAPIVAEPPTPDWGLFEPLHKPLGPLIRLVQPFITPQAIIVVLSSLLIYIWLYPTYIVNRSSPSHHHLPSSSDRLAAYEELWQREESQLWEWLENRVGLDGGYTPTGAGTGAAPQKILTARQLGKKLADERMTERQMDDAIRVTEERLDTLKAAIARKKKTSP